MATQWSPATQMERRQWLLTNGQVISEPDLEETPSGRKLRVKGTELTAYSRDLDYLLGRAANQIATEAGTKVWMPLHNRKFQEVSATGVQTRQAKLHIIHDPQNVRGSTQCWWRFKHPDLPIEVVLVIKITQQYNYHGPKAQNILAFLTQPQTVADSRSYETMFINETGSAFAQNECVLDDPDDRLKFRKWVEANPPDWDAGAVLGSFHFDGERPAVSAILRQVRVADALASVQIPDMRDPDNFDWLTLELCDSNVTQSFINDLVEYLDGTPSIEEAARLYTELQNVLRRIGVVMGDRTANDFSAALLSGHKEPLTVDVSPLSEVGHSYDHHHSLTMHLQTGTFVVDCGAQRKSNEIAEKWEEAQLIASMTGQEDVLLAYAKKYAEQAAKERAKKIIRERTPKDDS